MDNKFNIVQKLLKEEDIPEFIHYVPQELYSKKVEEQLADLNNIALSEITKDNSLIEFLCDLRIPRETDLNVIERLLKKEEAITGEFFKEEKKETAIEDPGTGFKKANTGLSSVTKDQPAEKDDCNVDEYILKRISKEILEAKIEITWDDIVGLEDVKKSINEIIIWPMLRPDIFTGLRGPPKGLLLFGPPGTGKTMIGKCIASQCKATFFSISASSLTSKWVGEGEKMVRALFYLARKMAPSVIFIDEVDSLLSQRSENENEGSRKIKTEFLVQFDGASVDDKDRILVIGATNRPQEIDDAARRRLVKRIYVPLPETDARMCMVKQLLRKYANDIDEEGHNIISELTNGYSGSDIFNLCREASLEPLREIKDINTFKPEDTRPIKVSDFRSALRQIRKSVSSSDLKAYSDWNELFGSVQTSYY